MVAFFVVAISLPFFSFCCFVFGVAVAFFTVEAFLSAGFFETFFASLLLSFFIGFGFEAVVFFCVFSGFSFLTSGTFGGLSSALFAFSCKFILSGFLMSYPKTAAASVVGTLLIVATGLSGGFFAPAIAASLAVLSVFCTKKINISKKV
ncbi:MAG: hypothetical protein IJQ21_03175 [Lachnospiraceae bacterium]|nr:hypothetical protein [Lachnospiraceae bacterium]